MLVPDSCIYIPWFGVSEQDPIAKEKQQQAVRGHRLLEDTLTKKRFCDGEHSGAGPSNHPSIIHFAGRPVRL